MSDDERISDLLLVWEERFEQGEDLSAEELCRDNPHLTEALAASIKALKRSPGYAGSRPPLRPRWQTAIGLMN